MQVKISYKKMKRLILRVKSSTQITLSVPKNTPQREIKKFLEEQNQWIKERIDFFQRKEKEENKLIDGEKIAYLGKHYEIKIFQSLEEFISLQPPFFQIYLQTPDDFSTKEAMIKQWYQAKAKEIFSEILHRYASLLGFEIKRLKISSMKTRWGSCNPNKAYINLNLELIKKDICGIEYVVLHELAHLKYPYHNQDFYTFVGLYMPDWKERKKLLLQSDF